MEANGQQGRHREYLTTSNLDAKAIGAFLGRGTGQAEVAFGSYQVISFAKEITLTNYNKGANPAGEKSALHGISDRFVMDAGAPV